MFSNKNDDILHIIDQLKVSRVNGKTILRKTDENWKMSVCINDYKKDAKIDECSNT